MPRRWWLVRLVAESASGKNGVWLLRRAGEMVGKGVVVRGDVSRRGDGCWLSCIIKRVRKK